VGAAVTQRIPSSANPVRLSADGRFVAYLRRDPNPSVLPSTVVLDRRTAVETLVVPIPVYGDTGLALSANGRVVAFATSFSPLLPDLNGDVIDVYRKDLDGSGLSRVSDGMSGAPTNGHSAFPALSADGRFVAFSSVASNLVPGDTNDRLDVFVRDAVTGATERVNVASDGSQSVGDASSIGSTGFTFCHCPAISADGRFVAFWSFAADLVAGDTNGHVDAFVHDRSTGETTRVSVRSDGSESHPFFGPVHLGISGNGRFVAFEARTGDLDARKTTPPSVQGMFIHDRETGVTELVSLNDAGESANDLASGDPHLTYDGRFVTFVSTGTNLVPDDTNGQVDIFMRDRLLGKTVRLNVSSTGAQGGGYFGPEAGPFETSDDGRAAAFSSPTSLDPSPTVGDVYLREEPVCGNGVVELGEGCDDGNTVPLDGCDSGCMLECGNGTLEPLEACDDGNRTDGDGCEADCRPTVCAGGTAITRPLVVLRKLGGPAGTQTVLVKGALVFGPGAPAGYDPMTKGAQLLIEDIGTGGRAVLDLSRRAVPIPGTAAGACSPSRDGWRAAGPRLLYRNRSGAIDPPTCTPGSAAGLRTLKLVDQRSVRGSIHVDARASHASIGVPVGPLRVTVVLGAGATDSIGGGCALHAFSASQCAYDPRRGTLTCS
jgi:cysteine-rich repeat protein